MPLPQQVINQLSQETPETTGWFSGTLTFSLVVLVLMFVIYGGMLALYEPYLNNQITNTQAQLTRLSQSISSNDESQLITFYSQLNNTQTLLQKHVLFSNFLSWLAQNTEANISYSQLSFTSTANDQIVLTGTAPSEADINQQLALFQASPSVDNVAISNVAQASNSSQWQFQLTLTMDPKLFLSSPQTQ